MHLADALLRPPARLIHWLLRRLKSVARPRTFGAHAIAMTPKRNIVLVKLRYAPGWRLPGGGRGEHEDPREAVLRELEEEIGMTGHGRVRAAGELQSVDGDRRDLASLLIVEDVRYAPRRWSWEIEAVSEAPLDALPPDLSPRMAEWIAAVRHRL